MRQSASTVQDEGRAAYALCEAAALAARQQALLDELRNRLDAFAHGTGFSRRLSAQELEQLAVIGEEVAELAAQIALLLDDVPLEPLAITERQLAEAAREALADGIVDQRRALTAARLLPAEVGFEALADALVASDAHAYWTVRVPDMLGAFRDVDEPCATRLAAVAGVPAGQRFCDVRPEHVYELAKLLRRLGTR